MTTRPPEVGDTIAHYRLDRVIGIGGMGQVFGATDLRLGRAVALKVMLGRYDPSDDFARRFQREAEALSSLDSPHIVSVYDHGEHAGRPYIVTQYADGGDLGRLLRERGRMPVELAVRVCVQLADALSDAHRAGVIHRDVKPANVLVRDARVERIHVYLCDFGVALTDSGGTTTPGAVAGTWTYLAPERIAGDPGSPASDIYSVGCLLWELLTGHSPYVGSDVEVAMQHHDVSIPRLEGSDPTSAALNRILARSLAKDPAARYATAAELRAELKALIPGGSSTSGAPVLPDQPHGTARPRQRRVFLASVVAGLLAAGGLTAWAATRGNDDPTTERPTAGSPPAASDPAPAEPSGATAPPTEPGDSGSPPTAPPLGDLDGDGFGDVSVGLPSGTATYLSDGSEFVNVETRKIDGRAVLLGDFGGDEAPELLRLEGEPPTMTATVVFEGAPRQISTISTPAPSDADQRLDSDILAADVDGDGVDDLVVATPSGTGLTLSVALNRGNGSFAAAETWLRTDLEWRRTIWAVGDFDGDGVDELVHTRPRELDDVEVGRATVLRSTGKALRVSEIVVDLPKSVDSSVFGLKSISAGDVDGDGVPDLVAHFPFAYGALVWHWTGDGFGTPETWADPPDTQSGGENLASMLSDVNGDGLADVVSVAVQRLRVHLSTGDSFVYAPEWDVRADITDALVSEVTLGIS